MRTISGVPAKKQHLPSGIQEDSAEEPSSQAEAGCRRAARGGTGPGGKTRKHRHLQAFGAAKGVTRTQKDL